MSSKKKTAAIPGTNPQALKIGSRVRCTDDGVEGRIVWANAVSVKIRWDDGEQITWRRDSLAGRPIEIIAEAVDEDQAVAPNAEEPSEAVRLPQTEQNTEPSVPVSDSTAIEPGPVEQPAEVSSTEPTETREAVAADQLPAEAVAFDHLPAADTQAEVAPQLDVTPDTSKPPESATGQSEVHASAKQPRKRRPKAADDGKEKRLSALDAAAKVLAETGHAMTCQEMIVAMAAKSYWSSPGGLTPGATLFSAMLREITTKGSASRFVKVDRGKFARNGAA